MNLLLSKQTNLLILIVILSFSLGNAANCYFVPSHGNWSDPNNWSCGYIPTNDTAIISSGQTVVISGPNPYNMNYEWYCSKLILNNGNIQTVTGINNSNLRVWGDADIYGGTFSYISTWIEGTTIIQAFSPPCFLINGSSLYLLGPTYQYSNISCLQSSAIRNYGVFYTNTSTLGNLNNNGIFINYGDYIKQGTSIQQFYLRFTNETIGRCIIENGRIRNINGVGSFINKHKVIIHENAVMEMNNSGFQLNVGSVVEGEGHLIVNNSFSGGGGVGTTTVDCKLTIGGTCTLNGNTFLMKDSVWWTAGNLGGFGGTYELSPTAVMTINFNGIVNLNTNAVNYGKVIGVGGTLNIFGPIVCNNYGNWILTNGFIQSGNSQSMFHNYGNFSVESGIATISCRTTNQPAGILSGNGRINFTNILTHNGWIKPGNSTGTLKLDLAGTFTLTTQNIEIDVYNNDGGGIGHDSLVTVDNILLNGTLKVNEMGCTMPGSFEIIRCENNNCLSGTFTSVILPANYTLQYTTSSVILTKTSTTCQHMVCHNGDNGDGSLRVALDCASDGQTIDFISTLEGDTIHLTTKELTLDKNLIIDASNLNHFVINGSQIGRVFYITPSVNVHLRDIKIVAGINHQGSAILNDGDLTLDNLIIRDTMTEGKSQIFNNGTLFLYGNSEILEF